MAFFDKLFGSDDEEGFDLESENNPTQKINSTQVIKKSNAVRQNFINEISIVFPAGFHDVQLVADPFKNSIPVIMNISKSPAKDKQRIVDFVAGIVYENGGHLEQHDSNSWLLTPQGTHLSSNQPTSDTGELFKPQA
jgi:cell division inhibitor SepF